MAETTEYDLIVIGGGPAGYAGAIRAGQLGKKVACIELERAGGTCLNWGCIPTKALLKSAELYQKMKKADAYGLSATEVGFDFAKVMERSRVVAGQMAKGVEFLLRKNKVDYFVGSGQVNAPGMVSITEGEHKGKFFEAKNILVATGCKMRRMPGVEFDGVRVMTSREALASTSLPKSIVIVGRRGDRRGIRLFLQCLRLQGDPGGDAPGRSCPSRTRRSRRPSRGPSRSRGSSSTSAPSARISGWESTR